MVLVKALSLWGLGFQLFISFSIITKSKKLPFPLEKGKTVSE